MESLTKRLKEFKLQISPSKTEEFEKPFITKVTIAKQRIEIMERIRYLGQQPLTERTKLQDTN